MMNDNRPLFPPGQIPDDNSVYEDCSAIIVGKKASVTGEVLFGHNEDDSGNNVMVQHIVPRATHAPGQMLTFEPKCAKIPQVEKTWKYYWSETRANWQASFSDIFVNEWGVAVASDSCGRSREDLPELTNGGIGYGLGHIIAQRARTAREGVEIAASLITKYGYTGLGRAYQIVDNNEGWVLQVAHGKHFAAKRVPDDEVMFIPNWFTIDSIDMTDKDNFIASPDLITYALSRGWYTPKSTGDHSDFSFRLAYQDPDHTQEGNIVRHRNALRLILGEEPKTVPVFSVKPPKKMSVDDVKAILRTHYEGTCGDLSNEYTQNPHQTANRTICTKTTMESIVIQMRDNPLFTCMWRATLNPCTSPYVPWYLGISRIPAGYGWIDPRTAAATHFNVCSSDLSYRPGRAWWAFHDVQDLADSSYSTVIEKIIEKINTLESQWVKQQQDLESAAYEAYRSDPEKAASILTEYTEIQARMAWRTWRALFRNLLEN